VDPNHVFALLVVILLYAASITLVLDLVFIGERLKGLLQLSYSIVIGYAAFLTATFYDRNRLGRIFLVFCILILVGCTLETFTGFRAVSDFVRERLFDEFLYSAVKRDEELYGGIRPNLFTSEPSNVAFAFTAFAFIWYVLTSVRAKTLAYAALICAGIALTRSPTVVLGFVLIVPYQVLLASRGKSGPVRSVDHTAIAVILLCMAAVAGLAVAGDRLFSERVQQIASNNDPSFFFRVIGPAAVAVDTIMHHPVAGAGLAGEDLIADRIRQIYYAAPSFSSEWKIARPSEVVTNYFWHHWIYLGLVWGVLILFALGWMLRVLGTPTVAFCFLAWAIMGQASGGYVSPRIWAFLLLCCAAARLYFEQPARPPIGSENRRMAPSILRAHAG
ncbi:unnamed protein product, partial [Laminaria digitata]